MLFEGRVESLQVAVGPVGRAQHCEASRHCVTSSTVPGNAQAGLSLSTKPRCTRVRAGLEQMTRRRREAEIPILAAGRGTNARGPAVAVRAEGSIGGRERITATLADPVARLARHR